MRLPMMLKATVPGRGGKAKPKHEQTAVRGLKSSDRPPATGFYRNPLLLCDWIGFYNPLIESNTSFYCVRVVWAVYDRKNYGSHVACGHGSDISIGN